MLAKIVVSSLATLSLVTTVPAQIADYQLVNSSVAHDLASATPVDLDLDGDLDVVTGSSRDDRVVWYENLGAGVFETGVELSRDSGGGGGVIVADVDQDGLPDLLATASNYLFWWRNLGGGEFAEEVTLASGFSNGGLHPGDLDGDGDLDMVIQSRFSVYLLEGQGPGVFGAPTTVYQTSNIDIEVEDLVIGELTGDTRLDIALVTREYDEYGPDETSLLLLPQLPNASFGPPVVLETFVSNSRTILLFDPDLDGDRDILRKIGSEVAWVRNDGAGQFVPQARPLPLPPVGGLLPADLDNDGDEDLIFTSGDQPANFKVGEIFITGPLSFVLGQETDLDRAPIRPAHADLDQDGEADLMYSSSDDSLRWHRRLPGGTYEAPTEITDRVRSRHFDMTDVDGDGLLDAVAPVTGFLDGDVAWYRRRPTGGYERSIRVPVGQASSASDLADLDGDGDEDCVVSRRVDGLSELIWLQASPSGFGPPIIIETFFGGENFVSPVTIDLDQDGDLDLVTTAYTDKLLSTYENLGGGVFGPRVDTVLSRQPVLSEPADLDGDGLVDVLIRSSEDFEDDRLHVSRNLGDGALGPLLEIGRAEDMHDIAFVDTDLDGDQEVLVVQDLDTGGREVVQYDNLGSLIFGPAETLIEETGQGYGLHIEGIDWDQDGMRDIVVLDRGRWIAWYRVLGPDQLAPLEVLTDEMEEGDSMRVVDFDGDQDLDFIVADLDMRALRIFENEPRLGESYCPSTPNSTGQPGTMVVFGSAVVADDHLILTAKNLPQNSNIGYFIMGAGMNTFTPPGSAGPICVTPGLQRLLPPVSNTNEEPGGFSRSVGTSGPQTGSITAGSTWNFQAWHRDSIAGTSNLTDAVSIDFQ